MAWSGLKPEHVGAFGEVLHRIALTVNSSLDIQEVLHRVANLTLEAIPAERCSMFLLDDSGTKVLPTLSIGKVTDVSLWQRFRSLDPVDLKEVPARWRAFRAGKAVGIADLAASRMIPGDFVETFGARSALLVPLLASGEPQGILSLDWGAPGRDFTSEELLLGEAIGSYAALAIRNARLYERLAAKARTLQGLVEVAGALNSTVSLRPVLDGIVSAFEELLGTSHCSVNLIDRSQPSRVRTLTVRGVSWFTSHPENLREVPSAEVDRVNALWERSAEPVVYPNLDEQCVVDRSLIPRSVSSMVLFPLFRPGALLGFVVAGFPHIGGPRFDELETGQALADQAATAISRADLHESLRVRVQRLEVLYRLSDVVAGSADLNGALRELNRVLRPELGIRLRSISLTNAQLRESVGAREPDSEELEAIRSWRAILSRSGGPLGPRPTQEGLLVPISHRNRVQGALRVALKKRSIDESEHELLVAVAGGCAEVIHKAGLRKGLAESERRLAVASERERIARDLHDSVGQLLTGMGMRLATYLSEAPDRVWRDRLQELMRLASKGSVEIREAIYSLLFLQVRRRGLAKAVKELSRKFETTTGISTRLQVQGDPVPLAPSREDALFRVAHQALMNIERHSRASSALIVLAYQQRQACLSVRDDGVGLAHRDPFNSSSRHFGLGELRSLIEDVGGQFKVRNASPRGVIVEALIPSSGKGTARRGREAGAGHRH